MRDSNLNFSRGSAQVGRSLQTICQRDKRSHIKNPLPSRSREPPRGLVKRHKGRRETHKGRHKNPQRAVINP